MTTTNNFLAQNDKNVFEILQKIQEENKLIDLAKFDLFSIFKEKKQYQNYNINRPLNLVLNSEVE